MMERQRKEELDQRVTLEEPWVQGCEKKIVSKKNQNQMILSLVEIPIKKYIVKFLILGKISAAEMVRKQPEKPNPTKNPQKLIWFKPRFKQWFKPLV